MPREQTEEEKAEAEAGKNRKAADARKPAKGKVDDEPSAEELERLNKEIADREKDNNKKRSEWEALDDNLKFYRTCEDPFKEPRITFLNGEGQEDLPPINIQETTIAESGLRAFEAAVIDEHGCYVYFDRIVPQEDEA